MISRLSCALLVLPALAACGDKRKAPTTPPPSDATDAGTTGEPDAGVASLTPEDPPRIAPHTTFISAVSLDRTGSAAVSLDAIGAIRLWRSLDGTQPPVALPQHGARALEVARDGEGYTVGSLDGSSAAHLYHFSSRGGLTATADIPAVPQALGLVPSSDGAWLIARADQSIALVDRDGAIIDELSRDGTRIDALRPLAEHDAMAIVSRQDGANRTYAAVTIAVGGGHLTWQREQPLAIAPVAPVELAIAPDGKHLAYFADPAAVKAAAAAAAAPVPSRPAPGPGMPKPRQARADRAFEAPMRPPPGMPSVVVVIDAATGADVTPKALAAQALSAPQRLGFLSVDAVAAYSQNSGDWTSALVAEADLVSGSLGRNCPPALAAGRVIAGLGQNLVVTDEAGTTRYLGYQFSNAATAAIAADGASAAWAASTGDLIIQPSGGGPELVVKLDDAAVAVDFVDAGHVIAVSGRGEIALIDATRGVVLERAPAPSSPRSVALSPDGRWLAGVRDGGGVWVVRVDLTQTPALGKPKVLSDGSFGFWFLDAATDEAKAMVTVDSGSAIRTFTAAQLATGVPVNKLSNAGKQSMLSTPLFIDAAGRVYVFDGRDLTRFGGLTMDAPQQLARLEGVHMLAVVPTRGLTLAADTSGTVRALADDGSVRWSVNLGAAAQRMQVTADGKRALLLSMVGALVVDTVTGAALSTACAWRFGAWPTAPQVINLGMPSLCE